tara:strand:- start:72 stop:239 length:168 start_codon:yes stop_codon:yes gene_type:complete
LSTKALLKEQKQVVEDEQEVVEKPATLASCAGALHEILTTQLAEEKPSKVAPGVL